MHMQERCHLVALDNRLAKDFSFYSMTINPKRDHTLYSVLITKNKTYHIPLP
jgi:hypothetical protein